MFHSEPIHFFKEDGNVAKTRWAQDASSSKRPIGSRSMICRSSRLLSSRVSLDGGVLSKSERVIKISLGPGLGLLRPILRLDRAG